jgi:hypothetical protein
MPNMLTCCTFRASAKVVPVLLLKNAVDGFLRAEFRILECFPRCSVHWVNVVGFPVLMFHPNGHVNNMWRCRKNSWHGTTLVYCSMRRLSTRLVVARTRVWRTLHDDGLYPFRPKCVQNLHQGDSAMRLEFCHWLHTISQSLRLILFTDEATFTRNCFLIALLTAHRRLLYEHPLY